MRVLAVCLPSPGHVNPMLPLLSALTAQGAEVTVVSGPSAQPAAERAGAGFAPAGQGFDVWFGRLAERIRGNPGDGLPPEQIARYFIPRLFAEIAADDMLDGAVAAGRELRPDLLVFETECLVGPLVAAVLRVRPVHLQVGLLLDPIVLDLSRDAIWPLWRQQGLEAPPDAGVYDGLVLRTWPSLLDPAVPPRGDVRMLRPVASPQPERGESRPRPLVHGTLGTVLNSDLAVFRAIIDAFVDLPADLLLTVGENNDPGGVGPVPDNVRVERYVEHAQLLPQCAAVIHHGGAGTMLSSLAHGLPQLVIPQGADQFANAVALRDAGGGLALLPGGVSAAAVASGVTELLQQPRYAEAAGLIAAEIAAMPPPEEVAAALVAGG